MKKRLNPIDAPLKRPDNVRLVSARAVGNQFDVKVASAGTEIALFDSIGDDGTTLAAFTAALRKARGSLLVRVNSPGGDFFQGIGIFNALNAYDGAVTVQIEGLAASAASLICMAGDRIQISSNAFMMIHDCWALAIGNRHVFQEQADLMAKFDGAMADTYATRTKQSVAKVASWMDTESWFTAEEAIAAGLADEVAGAAEISARFDLSLFANAPASIKTDAPPRIFRSAAEFERSLRENCGLSRAAAAKASVAGFAALTQDPLHEIEQRQLAAIDAGIDALRRK